MSYQPTVLLVEDDPDLARFAGTALRLGGYRPMMATDGEAAVATAQRVRPDVVLLDLRLPRMDGWAVLAALQDEQGLREVPVVMLTASSDPRDRQRARTERIADFVQKPITVDRLLDVVERALQTARPVPRA